MIEGAPIVGGFAWTMTDTKEMLILGGTDGDLIMGDLYSINFLDKKSTLVDDKFECNICFGKMAYRDGELMVVGGTGSAARNYLFNMQEKKWTLLEDKDSYTQAIGLGANIDLEIPYYEAVYF